MCPGRKEPELAALITALHRTAERLFDFPMVGPLAEAAAKRAVEKPARERGVEFEEPAINRIIEATRCYPYFLREWGKHVWDLTPQPPVRLRDVEAASATAVAALDESFFRVRFDRLTPSEKRYLRAMAELGAGPHRSGDIAQVLGKSVSTYAPLRAQLIEKGMVWSPSHGDTEFTVPLFDEFMRRIVPSDDWRDR